MKNVRKCNNAINSEIAGDSVYDMEIGVAISEKARIAAKVFVVFVGSVLIVK